MTKFLDGPAKDQVLMLKRAARFMRVVVTPEGTWDALDQLEDKPRSDERIYAYEIASMVAWAFVDGPKARGRYPVANYKFIEPQPSDEEMRTDEAWGKWCRSQPLVKVLE